MRRARTIDIELRGTSDAIAAALDQVAALARRCGFSDDRLDQIVTAVGEALTNARQHGHGKAEDVHIGLRAWCATDRLVVEVVDSGSGIEAIPPIPDLQKKLQGEERPTGWGVFLMRTLASNLEFSRLPGGKHQLRLEFDGEPPAQLGPARITKAQRHA